MTTLEEMLKIQKKFQDEHFPVDKIKISEISSAIASEALELWHDADGRWWKKVKKYWCNECEDTVTTEDCENWGEHYLGCENCCGRVITLEEHLKEESIDILHFLLLLWLKLGMTEEEILEVYNKKMGVNIQRQEKGY